MLSGFWVVFYHYLFIFLYSHTKWNAHLFDQNQYRCPLYNAPNAYAMIFVISWLTRFLSDLGSGGGGEKSSENFRAFQGTKWEYLFRVDYISKYFFFFFFFLGGGGVCLMFLIFFWVNSRCWALAYVWSKNESTPSPAPTPWGGHVNLYLSLDTGSNIFLLSCFRVSCV